MKRIVIMGMILISCGVTSRNIMSTNPDMVVNSSNFLYSLSATGTWREYLASTALDAANLDKWAWKCSLRFRSTKPVQLNHLVLQWKGKKIPTLSASLYQKKATDEAVVPIQDNFVCDGYWDPKMQQMHFEINKKIVAVNYYSLLLSFSKAIEAIVKTGTFEVIKARSTTVLE